MVITSVITFNRSYKFLDFAIRVYEVEKILVSFVDIFTKVKPVHSPIFSS
jgi:hypothetical protein